MFAYFCIFFIYFLVLFVCLVILCFSWWGGSGGRSVLLFSLFFADCSFVCRLSGTEVLSKKKLKTSNVV